MAEINRDNERDNIQAHYSWFYALIVGLAALCIGIWIGASLFADRDGYGMNLFTEFIGIGVTVLVIDRLRVFRDRETLKETLKRQLIRDAGSQLNVTAIAAVDRIRAEGWLTGDSGILQGANLGNANLERADLSDANLKGARLFGANLKTACLIKANLSDADLRGAIMKHAELIEADLQSAKLQAAEMQRTNLLRAHLRNANMTEANLAHAQLRECNLQGADLSIAILHEARLRNTDLRGAYLCGAILQNRDFHSVRFPDDVRSMDMKRFTDPKHRRFLPTLEKIAEIRRKLELDPIPST